MGEGLVVAFDERLDGVDPCQHSPLAGNLHLFAHPEQYAGGEASSPFEDKLGGEKVPLNDHEKSSQTLSGQGPVAIVASALVPAKPRVHRCFLW